MRARAAQLDVIEAHHYQRQVRQACSSFLASSTTSLLAFDSNDNDKITEFTPDTGIEAIGSI